MKMILKLVLTTFGVITAAIAAPFIYCCFLWILGYALYI